MIISFGRKENIIIFCRSMTNASPSRAEPGAATIASPPLDILDDVLHPTYVKLSTMPMAPRPVMGSPRREMRPNLIVPGPGAYFQERTWSQCVGGPKMIPATSGNPKREARRLDVPYYDLSSALAAGPKVTMSPRLPSTARRDVPGPGEYDVSVMFLAQQLDKKKAALPLTHCSFGAPHRPKKPNAFPGPGAYDTVNTPSDARGSPRGATLASRVPLPAPFPCPGPGAYDARSCFEPQTGRLPITLKGRLAHPLDDHLAGHECARTGNFHDPSKKMRAAPRLKPAVVTSPRRPR